MFEDKQNPPGNNSMSQLLGSRFTVLKYSFVIIFQCIAFHKGSEPQGNCCLWFFHFTLGIHIQMFFKTTQEYNFGKLFMSFAHILYVILMKRKLLPLFLKINTMEMGRNLSYMYTYIHTYIYIWIYIHIQTQHWQFNIF